MAYRSSKTTIRWFYLPTSDDHVITCLVLVGAWIFYDFKIVVIAASPMSRQSDGMELKFRRCGLERPCAFCWHRLDTGRCRPNKWFLWLTTKKEAEKMLEGLKQWEAISQEFRCSWPGDDLLRSRAGRVVTFWYVSLFSSLELAQPVIFTCPLNWNNAA